MNIFAQLDFIEYPINKIFQELDGTVLDSFFSMVSNIPLMIGVFGCILLILIWKQYKFWKPILFALIIALLTSYLVNEGIFKILFSEMGIFRPRPWTLHPDILAIGHTFRDSSFPSSHMAFTTMFVMNIVYFEKRFLPFGIMIIILMGISRIHNGMHYPSDVIAGIIMGLLYGYIGLFLMKKLRIEKHPWWKKWFKNL